jgi:multiple sugar transport system substrate-binding protein
MWMSTIKDVARAAGVSVSTVSNIINNKSSVNIEIYNRVMQVMKELNYRPNILAMNLRKNHMNFIGVVIHELSGYSIKLMEGVLIRLDQLGYQSIVKYVRDDSLEVMDTINQMLGTGVKGIVLCTPHLDEENLRGLDTAGAPILMLDYCLDLPGFLTLGFDNTALVRDLTRLLLEQGKTVGLVTGSRRYSSEKTCWVGFLEGLSKAGKSEEEQLAIELPFQRGLLYETLLTEISQKEDIPSCFIVSNEFFADCLREVLNISGQREHTLYVLSCQQLEKRDVPYMVMLRRDAVRCGQEAADILISQIRDPVVNDFPGRIISPEIDAAQAVGSFFVNKFSFPNRALRVLLPNAPMSKSIQLLSSDFTNRTGVPVEFVLKNMTELRQEIIRSCRCDAPAYDVITFHINWLADLGQQGYLKRLDECLDFEGMSRQYISEVRKAYFKRKYAIYGIPAEMGVQILAYRDDIFSDPVVQKNYYSAVGLELQPPRSWTEFNIIAKYFTREYNPSSPVQYGTCIAGHIPTGLVEEFWPRSWAFRGKIFENQSPALYSPQNIKALENLCDSYRYSYPDCRTFMDSEQVHVMLTGNIAMVVTYSSYMVLGGVDRGKRIKFSRTPSNMTAIDSYLFGIPAVQNKQKLLPLLSRASAAFIKWCCCDDVAVKSMLLGRLIPKSSVVLNGEIEFYNQGLKGMFDNIESTVPRDQIFTGRADDPVFEEQLASKLAQAVYEGVPAEKVLKELQELLTLQ